MFEPTNDIALISSSSQMALIMSWSTSKRKRTVRNIKIKKFSKFMYLDIVLQEPYVKDQIKRVVQIQKNIRY